MITRLQALKMMEESNSDQLKSMKDVETAIKLAAMTGNGSVSFFYPKKQAIKLKTKLRANDFYVETLTFASMPDEEHIAIFWDNKIQAGELIERFIKE